VVKKEPKIGGTIKLKRPPPKQNKPGNWRDSEVIGAGTFKNFSSVIRV
jgi:hypothetical protein